MSSKIEQLIDEIQKFRRFEPQKIFCLTENTDFKISPMGEIIKL